MGVDASAASDRAIEALILLTEPGAVRDLLLSVVEHVPIDTFGLPVAATIRPGALDLAMERGQEEAEAKVRAATELFERANLPASGGVLAMAGAAVGLTDAIERHEADLISRGQQRTKSTVPHFCARWWAVT